jgi:autotransporter-associated beta strand protein
MVTLNGGTFNNSAGVTIANAINVAGTTALYSVGGNNFSLSGSVTGNGTINTGGSLGGASSLTFTNTDLSGFTGTITHDNVLDKNNTQFSLPLNTTAKFSTTGTTVTNSRSLLFAGGTIGELSGTGGSVRLNGTLNVNQSTNTTYAGVIFNNGGLQKSGNGTLTLSNTNLYTGATAVNAGTLIISGSISDSSALTVAAGAQLRYNSASARTGALTLSGNGSASRAVLGGTGSINTAITLNNLGDTLSPGNSPGQQAYGVNQTWNSLTYLWEVNNFTGTTAGTDFDQINITGNLTLSGGLNAYQLDITSLTGLNANGNVGNFSEVNRSWTILTTTTGIVGFNAANWTLLTTNFTSSPAYLGTFSLAQANNNLVLSYAVPEPTTWGLLALSLTTVVVFRRRRR